MKILKKLKRSYQKTELKFFQFLRRPWTIPFLVSQIQRWLNRVPWTFSGTFNILPSVLRLTIEFRWHLTVFRWLFPFLLYNLQRLRFLITLLLLRVGQPLVPQKVLEKQLIGFQKRTSKEHQLLELLRIR